MFTLLSRLRPRELALRQAPTFLGALLIAEMFYKFHSFLLETGGFLLTWFVLDALAGLVLKLVAGPEPAPGRDL